MTATRSRSSTAKPGSRMTSSPFRRSNRRWTRWRRAVGVRPSGDRPVLKKPEGRQEVCTDRNNLLAEGFPATSFAYPFGSFDSGTELVVHDCGYNSGRGVSGVTKNGPYAETVPPLDPYATRT